jgi:hypothetical protein
VSEVAVAIEVPRGALVEALEEMGAHVYHVNPKQLDRMRDRYSASGAKDDRRDAFVLADSLRLNERFFRRVHVDDPRIVELREIGRLEAQLTEERTRLNSPPTRAAQPLLACPAGAIGGRKRLLAVELARARADP